MEAAAKLTSKGQITIPAEVRKILQLHAGDQLLFEVERTEDGQGVRVVVRKTPDFFELAGSVPTPPGWEAASWSEIREEAMRRHAAEREGRWVRGGRENT